MNDEQLNNELKERIKAVFNDYHDASAEKGWELLREKYPTEEEKRSLIWLWRLAGAAALLLVFLSIGLWQHFHEAKKPALIVKSNKNRTSPVIIEAPNHSIQAGANIAQQKTHTAGKRKQPLFTANKKMVVKTAAATYNTKKSNSDVISNTGLPGNEPTNNIRTADTAQSNVIAATSPVIRSQAETPTPPGKPVQSLFDNDKYQSTQNTDEQKIKNKKVIFSVYAATYVNYARGSNKQFNTGGGIATDIKLTENLSITTGLALAQNTLAYTSTITPKVSESSALTHNLQNTVKPFSILSPTSRDLNASLMNLDVPINFKYVFNPQKRNIYLSAGLSSGAFINETYNYTYNYQGGNNTASSQSQESSHNTFDNFYFASLLNLSFGIGYPLGKDQLVLEPFLKYPINGLGDQHILFGSGGINLKINFGLSRK